MMHTVFLPVAIRIKGPLSLTQVRPKPIVSSARSARTHAKPHWHRSCGLVRGFHRNILVRLHHVSSATTDTRALRPSVSGDDSIQIFASRRGFEPHPHPLRNLPLIHPCFRITRWHGLLINPCFRITRRHAVTRLILLRLQYI